MSPSSPAANLKWIRMVAASLAAAVILVLSAIGLLDLRPDADLLRASVSIRQRPEAIWPWLYEPEKLKQWVSWLVKVKPESPGHPQPGSQSTWTMEDRNSAVPRQIVSRVERVEPARWLSVQLHSPGAFTGTATYSLTSLGNGQTRLELESRYHFDSRLARFLLPLVTMAGQRQMAGDLEHLRVLLEADGRRQTGANDRR